MTHDAGPKVAGDRPKRPKTGGRAKGTPNRISRYTRGTLAALAADNIPRVQSWLDEVAKDDPAKAVELFLRLLEFTLPRLRASMVEVRDGAPRSVQRMSVAELEALVAGANEQG